MPRPRKHVPAYLRHSSGQARVRLPLGDGRYREILLGKYGSPESKQEFSKVIAQWEANGRRLPSDDTTHADLSVNELLVRFWDHAQQHYRRADGTPTNEQKEYRYSLRPLRELYGHTPVRDFGPVGLKAVRQRMIDAGWCRTLINQRVGRVRRAIRWGVSEGLVPVAVSQACDTFKGLARGRSDAPEMEPVKPVAPSFVDAVKAHVPKHVWGLIELQRATGARPGEVCRTRACDIDMSGPVWVWRLSDHKNAWRGAERVICIGPRGQAVIKAFLTSKVDDYLFSPLRCQEERYAAMRTGRKTPVQPSQASRRTSRPKKRPGERYTPSSYAHAVGKACKLAGVPHWHPSQLRHQYATEARRQFGLEHAGAALGHTKMSATQVYASRDADLAQQVALRLG
jgi:integrase